MNTNNDVKWRRFIEGLGESAPLNSYGNQSYSRKTRGGNFTTPPPLCEG